MPEHLKSISEARKNLPGLSQAAQKRMDRYVITHQGQPQSVLLGYEEYQGMKAATELLHRPEVVESIKTGLKELESNRRLSPEEVRNRLRERAQASETSQLATELAGKSGVDERTIAAVIGTFTEKLLADFCTGGKVSIPGVGTIFMMAPELPGKAPAGPGELKGRGRFAGGKPKARYLSVEPSPAIEMMLQKTEE
jgi:PHD/YefM family antitoxin component YafN of YafNO toxin-antitoxin module